MKGTKEKTQVPCLLRYVRAVRKWNLGNLEPRDADERQERYRNSRGEGNRWLITSGRIVLGVVVIDVRRGN